MAGQNLPQPDAEALAHSAALVAHIAAEIAAAGGWIPFSRYMELALYAPGLGYYTSDLPKLGAPSRGADFITAPELSPLFGATLANTVADIMRQSAPQVLECGAGSGRLAVDVLRALEVADCLPASLAARQREKISREVPHLAHRVTWLDALPARIEGAVIANELLDAMPVQVIEWSADGAAEHGVSEVNGQLAIAKRPLNGRLEVVASEMAIKWAFPRGVGVGQDADGRSVEGAGAADSNATGVRAGVSRELARTTAEGVAALPTTRATAASAASYVSEISLAAQAWVRSATAALHGGALLLVDYGFPAHEFYHPQRNRGTLMCHYRHYAHQDPLWMPGLCDITAHVDFSAMARAAHESGGDVAGYTSQAAYLIDAGLIEALMAAQARLGATETGMSTEAQRLALNNQVQRLTSPAEMGELFKVLCISKGAMEDLRGFRRNDRSHTL
jgi:SAM-dependent MidA family methyltransferase